MKQAVFLNKSRRIISNNRIYRDQRRFMMMGYSKSGNRLIVKEIAKGYSTGVTPVRGAL
jgi:DNA-binding GntR family transcriptional regulator